MPSDERTPIGLDYQWLFQKLPGRYIVCDANDPSFTIVDENEAHALMTGTRREDNTGRPVLDVFPDNSEKYRKEGVSELLESFRKVIRNGKPDSLPIIRYDIKDEFGVFQERYFRLTHYPLKDAKGKVVAVYQNSDEVTERVRSDRQRQIAEDQLTQAMDIAQVGTWMWDIRSNKVITDKNLAAMFGVSRDEAAAGLPLSVFIESMHPADRKRVEGEIARAIQHCSTFDSEYRTIGSDGAIHWLLARGRVEVDETGKPAQLPGVLLDITERKRAEGTRNFLVEATTVLAGSMHYRQTLKRVAALAVPEVADWCAVDILVDDNKLQQVAMAHKDPAKLRWARKLRRQATPNHVNSLEGFARVAATGKPDFAPVIDQHFIQRSDLNAEQIRLIHDLEVSSFIRVPLRRENKIVGILTLVGTGGRHFGDTDLKMAVELANHASLAITNTSLFEATRDELKKRQKLEERLRRSNEDLEKRVLERTTKLEELNTQLNRSNSELQDFAYVASHDLQEPLRKIQAFGNLLEQEYGKKLGEGTDYLKRMRNAAARMSELITDLLSFSRVTTKVRPFTPTDLSKVVQEVLGDLETRLAETGGTIEMGTLPLIDADPMQMRQIFQNLISNALKFHRPDVAPKVCISAKAQTVNGERFAEIQVSDNGVGFDEKYLDRIFAVFQRLHGRDQYEGTGIGLAVCRKIAERHHGTITARSQPGKGATFIVRLPIRQADTDTIASDSRTPKHVMSTYNQLTGELSERISDHER